jgi:hypothetical protein
MRICSAPAATEVRTTQDLMLLSGLPSVVREGDRLPRRLHGAQYNRCRRGKVALTANAGGKALAPQQVSLAAGQAREIGWDYQVPASPAGRGMSARRLPPVGQDGQAGAATGAQAAASTTA